MAKEIAEEYASSLADLTVNSKPLINMLTILAEENIDHAGTIVETVEKHLEKVNPDVKLPVLYLVDSIIKNVGGAYIQKFSQSIVNMFTRTFRMVDEKIRSQMFKLRETWHEVLPPTKLYQLDVKVNLLDPAWPIQAQPHQSNIHPAATASTPAVAPEDDEKMRSILAKKEQELLMLQKKKVEMELEQMRRQLELEKAAKKAAAAAVPKPPAAPLPAMPVALVTPVAPEPLALPVKQRLGPPVSKPQGRIAPVSAALIAARRDPRLARHPPPPAHTPAHPPAAPPAPVIAPNVFDIKPLERVTKRKNVITIDVSQERAPPAPRRRDPRLDSRRDRRDKPKDNNERERDRIPPAYIDKIPDARKISKLPPIPKINREERADAPSKRKKETRRKRPERADKDESSGSSPEKKQRNKKKLKEPDVKPEAEPEPVPFKELKNYHKERYMRRNRDKSESPEPSAPASAPAPHSEPSSVSEAIESKDVDLRVLPTVEPKAAVVGVKRSSTETLEGKPKKTKIDKFDILFGNEDVDLRQLPQVDEIAPANDKSPKHSPKKDISSPKPMSEDEEPAAKGSPKKDWNEVKEKDVKKAPSKLDLVRAKLAEATKGKDRLGRPLLFSKSPSVDKERERRRTISFEDTDMRNESGDEFDAEDNKKTISIIMSQAKEQFNDGQLDKNQYNALMYQVLQLNEKLKLKEAKQRESLEVSKLKLKEAKQKNKESLEASKRKLKALDGDKKVASPKSSPNNFGDIDDRVVPSAFMDTPPDSQGFSQDFDMRTNHLGPDNEHAGPLKGPPGMPNIPNMPMFGMNNVHGPNQFGPMWRGPRPRMEEFGPRRFRGPVPGFYRGKTRGPRPPFERLPIPPLPTPKMGMRQGECPLKPYERVESPPPLGAPGFFVPPTDYSVVEYIDQDPVKTIQIDGVPREIRFYGDTAVIMLDWDDPREIKFLPGSRRVTFDNKDSVVLTFNEGYKQVEIEDQVFDIKFGAPTRELYINGRWHECFFGGNPLGVIIDGKPRLVHLEGPLPQVDIGKEKRMDLVAGKINLIVNATQMCPVYLDAKVQKFTVDNQVYTLRFADALRTVLINEQPYKVEYGDLPKPIFIGNGKHFVRFSALPRNVKPGFVQIANMEGVGIPTVANLPKVVEGPKAEAMEVEEPVRPAKTPSPDAQENQGLDILASVMPPSSMEFASGSDYSVAEPLFPMTDKKIPGLETPVSEKPGPITLPGLGNINVTDLFAKLVATGIVQQPPKENKEEEKKPPKEDSNKITRVDMLQPQTMRGPQPGYVSKLYGGMQCSGCGSRFPPEQTVRYSQHLDWHFRQNRRERDSARRAHSRHWHYDLSDWLQYEEIDEIEDREKNWFETTGLEAGSPDPAAEEEAPSVAAGAPHDAACAMCGDSFHQFYNEDKEEWHLRNSVRHEDLNYHPMCLDDYKASLAKEEEEKKKQELVASEETEKEAPIEIKDVDESVDEQSDSESVVEVLDEKEEPLEIYDAEIEEESGDEDDVIYKAEPVEEVLVEDDADTDDETATKRQERDARAALDFARVKIKQEPIDPDDEPIITAEEETVSLTPEPTLSTVHSSIDGNSTLASAAPAAALPEIRINISKAPIPSIISGPSIPVIEGVRGSMLEDISTDDEPLPPGEEVELQYKLKPTLEGVRLSRTPPEKKGIEESGLCSIM